jgi:UDP-N-acetylmuramate dehydrogenase
MRFNADTAYKELHPHFQERVRRNEPLARHCTFGVGGPADVWISLESREELIGLVRLCVAEQWPLLITGNSTNVLYADAGARGIVARVALNTYSIDDRGDGTALLTADAGVSWPRLLHELTPIGWGGLEFGIGIPGTLGGAVISNAGAHNEELGEVLEWIEVLDARRSSEDGENGISLPQMRRYLHDELDLSYRHSRFRKERRARFDEHGSLIPAQRHLIDPPEIVVALGIRLRREDPQHVREAIARYKEYRKMAEPVQRHTGTVFKDPPGHEASHLIDQAGLKGKTRGKAQIAERNANYIVNLGGTSASDIAGLVEEAHRRVLEQFGIDLELDVELHGDWTVE